MGTPLLLWRDLLVIVRHLPPSSALGREIAAQGEEEDGDTMWDLHAHLLAAVFDALRVIDWRLGSGKRSEFPGLLARPGVRPTRIGRSSMSLDEARQFVERRRRGL